LKLAADTPDLKVLRNSGELPHERGLNPCLARDRFIAVEPSFRPLDSSENRIDAISDGARKKMAVVIVPIAAAILVWAAGMYSTTPKTTPWRIASDGLHVDRAWQLHDFYPKSELQLNGAKVIDFTQNPAWRPAHRERGEGGAGYNAGNWILANRLKVRLHVAREKHGVLIPRSGERPVLIGVDDPEAFLAKARAAWGVQ
jgi:hypothetical protein